VNNRTALGWLGSVSQKRKWISVNPRVDGVCRLMSVGWTYGYSWAGPRGAIFSFRACSLYAGASGLARAQFDSVRLFEHTPPGDPAL